MKSYETNRRRFLACAGAVFAEAFARTSFASPVPRVRSLAFSSLHTGETLDVTYWAGGSYIESALIRIDRILRDHRTGDVIKMDVGLLDLLHTIRTDLATVEPIEIISGYRSPRTNARLRKQGRAVATGSLHMDGKAADIRIPGISLKEIRDVSRVLGRGGVGYYEGEFVHVDVGRVRTW